MTSTLVEAYESIVEPQETSALQGELRKEIERSIEEVKVYNPYIQTREAREALQGFGITTLPRPTKVHPHPASKAIENYMLVQAGHHLDDTTTVCFSKQEKLRYLFKNRATPNVKLLNERVTAKDLSRYGDNVVSNVLMRTESSTVFVHDAMHYYTPDVLGHMFRENPNLEKVVYTLVIPPEVQARDSSLHPHIYTLHYPLDTPEMFEFRPDGSQGACYKQRIKCVEWLYLAHVVGLNTNVTVERLETLGAHHLFVAVRGRYEVERARGYSCGDMVLLPRLWVTDNMEKPVAVSRDIMMRTYYYGRSLKEVTERDLMAKLRQIMPCEGLARYDIITIEWLVQVILMMLELPKTTKSELIAGTSALKRWSIRAQDRLYSWCEAMLGYRSHADSFREAANLQPYNFDKPTTTWTTVGTFVRHEIEMRQVRASSRGKRIGHHVDMAKLARMELDIDAELQTELHLQQLEWEMKQPRPDLDELIRRVAEEQEQQVDYAALPQPPLPRSESVECSEQEVVRQVVAASITKVTPASKNCAFTMDEIGLDSECGSVAMDQDGAQAVKAESADRVATFTEPTVHNEGESLEAAMGDTRAEIEKPPTIQQPKNRNDQMKRVNPEVGRVIVDALCPVKWKNSEYTGEGVELIRRYGVDAGDRKFSMEGELIDPLWVNANPPKDRVDDQARVNKTATPYVDALIRVGRHIYKHTVNKQRAAAYASDLQYGTVGTLYANPKFNTKLEPLKRACQRSTETAYISVLLGAGGAGKSHHLQEVMRKTGNELKDVTIIVPTTVLRDEWAAMFPKARPDAILTYERALMKHCGSVVVLDDFGKLPHGYIDTLITQKNGLDLLVLTGDFRQSVYHETCADAAIARLSPEMDVFAQYSDYYLNLTRRCPDRIARALKVYPANPEPGSVKKSPLAPEGVALLVPSTKQRDGLVHLGRQAFTYSGSQGITRDSICVMLTSDTKHCDSRTMYTAFTRAKKVIYLTEETLGDREFMTKLEVTPYLKSILALCREPDTQEHKAPEPVVRETTPRTHLPVETSAALGDNHVEELGPTEDRELFDPEHGRSNVFQAEEGEANRMQHHQAKDATLVKESYSKRLDYKTQQENQRTFKHTRKAGLILWESFKRAYNLPPEARQFDGNLWAACQQEVEGKYLTKTAAQLMQQGERQDPDFEWNYIKLFLKSQTIKKDEKYALPKAKAGQPITSFKQETVMRTGVIARYVRRVLQQYQPTNVYIHTETSDLDFHSWVRDHWDFDKESYESDYTMYDQSQGGECLNFELMLCKYAGVPAQELHFYSTLKQCSKVYKGTLKIMRLSGEGPTFDFNTFCNIAYHHTKYFVQPGTAQCYAGDDMAQCGRPIERPGWNKIASMFQLVAKPVHTRYPSFIGFRLTPYGVVRSPLKLLRSLRLAEQKGNIAETLEAYARDIYYMYCLGDAALDGRVFTEAEVTAHQLALRLIHKYNFKPVRPANADGILPLPASEEDLIDDDWLTRARKRLEGTSKTRRRNAGKARAAQRNRIGTD